MKTLLNFGLLFVLLYPCQGQQFQIIKSDGSVFKTIQVSDYVSVVTGSRNHYNGQLTEVTPETIRINQRGQLVQIPVNEIIKAKKTSKFGIGAARLSPYSSVVPLLFIPSINSSRDPFKERTWAGRFVGTAAIVIPIGVALGTIMNLPFYKKAKRGYSFRTNP